MRTILALLLILVAPPAFAAGGAYAVDDSEVTEPGTCKADAWASFSDERERKFVVSPACTFSTLPFLEVSAAIERERSASREWSTGLGPKLKANLLPIEERGFGLAVAVGAGYATRTSRVDAWTAALLGSVEPMENMRVNLNLGWERDREADRDFLTWGAGADVGIAEGWTLIGEVFGKDRGRTSAQFGVRPTVWDGRMDIDLIYGRNLGDERAHWLTLGVTLRF
jgi:opacity protein-like surface antigen